MVIEKNKQRGAREEAFAMECARFINRTMLSGHVIINAIDVRIDVHTCTIGSEHVRGMLRCVVYVYT